MSLSKDRFGCDVFWVCEIGLEHQALRTKVTCLQCLHRAPGGVQHPLLERILHAHDLGTTKQEVKLLLLQLSILLQNSHTQLSCNNQLVTLKQTLQDAGIASVCLVMTALLM